LKFDEKVYELCKKIPKEKVSTYKEVGDKIGVKCYRAIGQALKRNKDPENIPCFKIIKSNGEIGGYQGKNYREKIKRLEREGIKIVNGKIDLKRFLYKF